MNRSQTPSPSDPTSKAFLDTACTSASGESVEDRKAYVQAKELVSFLELLPVALFGE